MALRCQGRVRRRNDRVRPGHGRPRRPPAPAGRHRRRRHLRHRRRPSAVDQRVDHRLAGGGGVGGQGVQARRAGVVVRRRCGRRARGARCGGGPRTRGRGPLDRRGRARVLLRAPASTRRCGSPARSARSSASPRCSTSSARWPTRPGPAYQVIGVSDPAMADKMLGVLAANGTRRAMVVHGDDGLDELSTTGPVDRARAHPHPRRRRTRPGTAPSRSRSTASTRPTSGWPGRRSTTSAAATPRSTPTPSAASWPATRRPIGTSPC